VTAASLAPLGDAALLVTLGDRVDTALAARVRALAARLRAAPPAGVHEVVPAYAALAVYYDPLHTDYDAIAASLRPLLAADAPAVAPAGREVRIPVRYDGADLDDVARATGLSRAEVVARHSSAYYEVLLLGFMPGFAYMGELDRALVLPRRASPRTRVPAGSVAIAGAQTAIYPFESPGGWHLLGTTDVVLFDAQRDPPALLAPGDRVRFDPIDT
jgi:KipI family sensor histidine kinase inhibitor